TNPQNPRTTGELLEEANLCKNTRATAQGDCRAGKRIRRSPASCLPAALRFAIGTEWGSQVMGGSQGLATTAWHQEAGGQGGRSSVGVCGFRRRDSEG